MSAREVLVSAVFEQLYEYSSLTEAGCLAEANRRVDAFAHELAKRLARKIQAENPDRDADWSAGVDWTTALIAEFITDLECGK